MQTLALAGRGRNLLPSPRSRKEGSMQHTEFIATGFHVPERVVTNAELSQLMDTSDEWITQRSGIKTRYWVSEADAWIRTGQYRRVLLVGAEVHSRGLDKTTRGRDTAVLFGDGAGVAILGPTDDPGRGVLSTHLYADGRHAEKLWVDAPGLAHDPFISVELMEEGRHRAVMEGREVFKFASVLMPQSVATALEANGLTAADVKLLVPHQANLRILEMVQKAVGLRDDQVYVNIQKYGNTTAASIPIALHEALCEGRLERRDLLVMTAFGSGFTWASAAIRW